MKKRKLYFLILLITLILVPGFFYTKRGKKIEVIRTTSIVGGIEVNFSIPVVADE